MWLATCYIHLHVLMFHLHILLLHLHILLLHLHVLKFNPHIMLLHLHVLVPQLTHKRIRARATVHPRNSRRHRSIANSTHLSIFASRCFSPFLSLSCRSFSPRPSVTVLPPSPHSVLFPSTPSKWHVVFGGQCPATSTVTVLRYWVHARAQCPFGCPL